MKKKLIIFGNRIYAEIAWEYFSEDSDYEVVAFTVDKEYIKSPNFCGLPVVAFEDVEVIIYDQNKTTTINSEYAIVYNSLKFMEFNNNVKITTTDSEVLTTDKLYYDTENDWLFTENNFEYIDKTNKIIANRLDSNRDFTDLVTGSLTGSINITEE